MFRAIILAFVVLLAPTALFAQQSSGSKKPIRAENKVSIAGGMGFTADVNSFGGASRSQFLMQFDAMYSMTNNLAIGGTFQVAPSGGSTTIGLTADARVYLPLGKGDNLIGKLAPYGGVGIGFRSYTNSGTDFLFPIIFGLEYDVSRHVSLTSDMRFNITSGDTDRFYYSWQMIGARVRF